jgi:hypothetical protein
MVYRTQGLALAALLALWGTSATASTRYALSLPLDGGAARGTITTSGTVGPLRAGDIEAYAIEITRPDGRIETLTERNSVLELTGDRLRAETDRLVFDFTPDGAPPGSLLIHAPYVAGTARFCAANDRRACPSDSAAVPATGGPALLATAEAAPAPLSWALLVAGFAALGLTLRRQQASRVSFA